MRLRSYALRTAAIALTLGALGFVAYELIESPSNQIFGRTLTQGPADQRLVALTYDDGPNPPYTLRILKVLESERVPATFFLVGRAVQSYPAVVRQELHDGDAIGNHTWDHTHLIMMTRLQIRSSLDRTSAAIYAATGEHTKLMRPPFGSRDWLVMQVAHKMGYTVVMWSVPLARDWEYPSAHTIAQRIVPQVKDGSIVVLHDGNRGLLCARYRLSARVCDRSADIGATTLIVRALKRQGFRFVTIPQLIAASKGATHTPVPGVE